MQEEEKYFINKIVYKEFMEMKELTAGTKLTLFALIGRLGGKRYCWPSQQTIAYTIGISDRQIRTHLKKLQEEGFIRVFKPEDVNIKNKLIGKSTNVYDLSYFLTKEKYQNNNEW